MSSMRFNARLDTPRHGPPHPFKQAGVVADSLTGSASSLSTGAAYTMFLGVPQVKLHTIQIWGTCRPCSGSSSTYPSVMIGVIENI
jgi:hypothetical protein